MNNGNDRHLSNIIHPCPAGTYIHAAIPPGNPDAHPPGFIKSHPILTFLPGIFGRCNLPDNDPMTSFR
jgi:hypothetical protein